MKQATLTAVLMTVLFTGFARINQTEHHGDSHEINSAEAITTSIPETREMLSEIMSVIGLAPNFELKEAKVQNVQASISHRKRYILYNPEFISWLNNTTNDKWAYYHFGPRDRSSFKWSHHS